MARSARSDVFAPEEIAIAHVTQRCVRRCFLMGFDPISGRSYDHRKQWLEQQLRRFAAHFGIDLICFAILSNHFHLVLRSRPDVVAQWDDAEVARRWLMICPRRRNCQGKPEDPTETEIRGILTNPQHLVTIRRRLSDFSWWMRLLSQPLAARANKEDLQQGRFWQGRFRAVRIYDEASMLACAAYVDLNLIRAAAAETLEESHFTSVQRRIESLVAGETQSDLPAPDHFLAPVEIDERMDSMGAVPSALPYRASDKGFVSMSALEYIQLLDWTARQIVPGKAGATPAEIPPVFERLGIRLPEWTGMVSNFDRIFYLAAGLPETLASRRTRISHRRFHTRQRYHELFAARAA